MGLLEFVLKSSHEVFDMQQALELNNHEIALTGYNTTNSFPNVNASNNIFTYSPTGAAPWTTITLRKGVYSFVDINSTIKASISANGDDPDAITLEPNVTILGSTMTITGTYSVDFTVQNSINSIAGFNSQVYGAGVHLSESIMQITKIKNIVITLSICTPQTFNGRSRQYIYSLPINVAPGHVMANEIGEAKYIPTVNGTFSNVTVQLQDENGAILDNMGEDFSISLHIKSNTREALTQFDELYIKHGDRLIKNLENLNTSMLPMLLNGLKQVLN